LLVVAVLGAGATLALMYGWARGSGHTHLSEPVEVRVPMQDGRVDAADLLQRLKTALDDPLDESVRAGVRDLDWQIDPRTPIGRHELRLLAQMGGATVRVTVEGDDLVLVAPPQVRTTWLEQQVDTVVEQLEALRSPPPERSFGIHALDGAGRSISPAEWDPAPRRLVLLIHGLDEPGYIFDDLPPPLLADGYSVARFEYPNDGPIADSADLLAEHLQLLRAAGVEHVDIVAHSMGGLVTRDVLTREEHYGGDGSGSERFPAIDRLIMLGTPHHGSHFARARLAAELKERVYRMFTTRQGWRLNFDREGAGEAGLDLLPDSAFLQELNSRPAPSHTRPTIVAGRWVPVDEALDGEAMPAWLDEWLKSVGDGVGDGVVTVESASWEAVDDIEIVEANHLSMLYNPLPTDGEPPGIRIVLDRLARPLDRPTQDPEETP
jgi:pimeloyl-ACP methyl ester carboxylesterase